MPVTAIGLGIGAYKLISGAVKEGKANRVAEELGKTRPKRNISSYAQDDFNLAKSELAQGMSADAERAYDSLNNKQLTNSLDAILKSGGSPNNVGEVYGQSNGGRMNFAILKDNARLSRVNNLVRAYQMMNEEDQANFAFNEFAPWKDKAEANGQARMGAQAEQTAGLNTIGGTAMGYFQNQKDENLYEKYFGKPNRTGAPTFNSRTPAATVSSMPSRYNPVAPQRVGNFGVDSSQWNTPQPLDIKQGFMSDEDMYNSDAWKDASYEWR